jgi:ATP:corrinoid adenosyltransferase
MSITQIAETFIKVMNACDQAEAAASSQGLDRNASANQTNEILDTYTAASTMLRNWMEYIDSIQNEQYRMAIYDEIAKRLN